MALLNMNVSRDRGICAPAVMMIMAAMAAMLIMACSDDGLAPADTEGNTAASSVTEGSSASMTGVGTDSASSDSGETSQESATATESGGTSGVTTSESTGGDTDTGTDGTTGGVSGPACEADTDCMVIDDCCSCMAIHNDAPAPEICEIERCFQSTCNMYGVFVPTAICRFGTCELEPLSCNQLFVTCDAPPPVCQDGELPSVGDDGCWTNMCVPVRFCDVVSDCTDCGEDETCVTRVAQAGFEYSCEPVAPSCAGVPSCDCMDPCLDPFICSDSGESGNELACDCPTCG